jgi:hypothetical protein
MQVNTISFIYLFLGGIGIWTQGLTLARQALYHLSHSASPTISFKKKRRTKPWVQTPVPYMLQHTWTS